MTWKLQTSFIEEMHKRGMKVVPFLSNHWQRTNGINAMHNRVQLVHEIAAAIEKHHLDGVNVDIEGITVTYHEEVTDFIRILGSLLPADKELNSHSKE